MRTRTLDSGWWATEVGAAPFVPEPVRATRIPATVPGTIHTDLLAAKLIPDPYVDRNEELLTWIGDATWQYETTFELTSDELNEFARHELHFDGLDTVTEIRLNGAVLGHTENMHRSYSFDVIEHVRTGANHLQVTFTPVREYTSRVQALVGEFPATHDQPFNYVRKMASNFGWDWGPILVTAGIWKPVTLRSWSTARLDAVRPKLSFAEHDGMITGRVQLDLDLVGAGAAAAPDHEVEVDVTIADTTHTVKATTGSSHLRSEFDVSNIELWWPRECGEQRLYELSVCLRQGSTRLDEWSNRVGFRSVELVTEPDADGESFEFVINGRPLFVRGVNWIPDDCFVAGIDRDQYHERLTQAADAHVNLVRVWGGGIYEKDEFYDVCDELGLLVWQDFLFACAAYPEEEPLRGEVIAEARDNVTRLMPHPSLVLWNGNNENIWGYQDWDWKDTLAGRGWGLGYYLHVLPTILAELDPTRPYWPGSPYSGRLDVHPNNPAYGNTHLWDVWNKIDYTAYAGYRPRFVSEFGFQAPPNWSTLERAITERPLRYDSETILAHQKADSGNRKLADGMAPHLPAPPGRDSAEQMADWHYLTQLNQARAVEFGIRHLRALSPLCRGSIVWQINDCWPVTSWSAIDGDGRLKPLWYAMRRAYEPVLLTIDATTIDGLAVAVINDSIADAAGRLTVERVRFDGTILAESAIDIAVPTGETGRLELTADLVSPETAAAELIRARFNDSSDLYFFAEDKSAALPPARYRVKTSWLDDGVVGVTVIAETVLRDLVIAADRIDPSALVDDQLVTLLPGEEHTFTIRTTVDEEDTRWASAAVIRCVNDIAVPAHTKRTGSSEGGE